MIDNKQKEMINLIGQAMAYCKRIKKLLTSVDDRLARKREVKE